MFLRTILMVVLVNESFYPRECPCGHVYYNDDPTHALFYIAKLFGIAPAFDSAFYPADEVCSEGISLFGWVVLERYFDVSGRTAHTYIQDSREKKTKTAVVCVFGFWIYL